ncbi:hypothetical protein QQ045_008975 [Rhodiola kirilowii]
MLLLVITIQPIFPWYNRPLASAQVHHEGCLEKCGNVEVPFPFGTTDGCYCDTHAVVQAGYDALTACGSLCGKQGLHDIVYDGTCSGLGCCQSTIPKNIFNYTVSAQSYRNHSEIWEYNPCSYVFVAENSYYNFSEGDLQNGRNISEVPTVIDWAIGSSTCENARNSADFACRNNSKCVDSTNGPGYRCSCKEGYKGNPYVPDGCQDIDECVEKLNPCGGNTCENKVGKWELYIIQQTLKDKLPLIEITVGISVGLAAFLIVGSWLYWGYNKRKHLLRRQRFFEQNGGLMLRKELSGKEGYTETAKIFTANELKQATNNFDESRIIGRGGFGTVYKGILEDEKVIAIKKSKVMDQDQIEQFINEVIVLSQINHRNVVRLLGCCLETEVPLLVYEYVSNGTLHEHIHEKKKNSSEVLSWEIRLRIAAEVAGVLAYLHSEASVPIVHRDIKCTNILLDDNCIAKVSDFGASRLVPIDQDMLSTMVQGTIGYLDPEYLHTSQLTEKSDVYCSRRADDRKESSGI